MGQLPCHDALASGAHGIRAPSLESSKALCTPPHSPQRPKWATALAVGPAQIDTASLPRTGHQLYLPQQDSALPPQPSTICPLRLLRGQPNLGHPLSPALGSHTGDRPRQVAAPWERLDAALCPLPAPSSQTHAHRYPPIPGQLVFSPHVERGRDQPLSVLKYEEKCVFRSMTPVLGSWAQFSLSCLKSRHFCFKFFFILRKQKQKSALIYLVW